MRWEEFQDCYFKIWKILTLGAIYEVHSERVLVVRKTLENQKGIENVHMAEQKDVIIFFL